MKDEEMIKDIKEVQPFFYGNIAEMFIEKGYRKESDTAKEICEKVIALYRQVMPLQKKRLVYR